MRSHPRACKVLQACNKIKLRRRRRYERQLVAQRLQLAAEADARSQAADAKRRQERERHAADLVRLAKACGQPCQPDMLFYEAASIVRAVLVM